MRGDDEKAMYLLGIDIGTTNWKVTLYDENGGAVAAFSSPTVVHSDSAGRVVYNPDEIWATVTAGIRQVLSQVKYPQDVRAIGVASMGEAGVLIDRRGQCLYPAMAWYDPRTAPQLEWWVRTFGRYEVYEITGLPPQHIASINKIMWLRDNEPEAYTRADKWLCLADFVTYRLCGECAMDYSLASRTMVFDLRRREWSLEMLEHAGVEASLLPPLRLSGTPLGHITRQAQEETGLSPGTIVVVGGYDHLCGALAGNAFTSSSMLDSGGTSEVLLSVVDAGSVNIGNALCDAQFAFGVHVVKDAYYIAGILPASGGVIEWLKDQLAHEELERARETGASIYQVMADEASSSPPGARGVFMLPHLKGRVSPYCGEKSRAAFVGLSFYHDRRDLFRAALEGLCYELRFNLDAMKELALIRPPQKMQAIGGAVRNKLWMQMKADMTGAVIEVPDVEEATTLGAALLAGIGSGIYRDEQDAIQRTYKIREVFHPNPEMTRKYDLYFRRVYKPLATSLDGVNADIADIFDV
ncbi:MAG: carbohydrate kinase [Firmicutes bacterium]|nr:carbohydrate kinase [Bacillota bacterium]